MFVWRVSVKETAGQYSSYPGLVQCTMQPNQYFNQCTAENKGWGSAEGRGGEAVVAEGGVRGGRDFVVMIWCIAQHSISHVPAGIMFNPAVCVCMGQLGRGARPGNNRSQHQYPTKAFLTLCKRDCVAAKKPNLNLIHTYCICYNPEKNCIC